MRRSTRRSSSSIDSVRLFVERAQAVDPTFALTLEDAPGRRAPVPSPRRSAPGDRAGGVARRRPPGRRDRRSPGRSLPPPGRRQPDGAVPPADAQGHAGLELQPADRAGAPDAPTAVGVRRRRAARCHRSDRRARRGAARATRSTLLGELVDQSLVTLDDATAMPRYRMLETVREYGRDRLVEHGERAAIESAHTHLGAGHRRGRARRPVGTGLADDVRSARDRARQPAGRAGSEPVGGSRPGARSGRPPLGVLAVERLPGRGPSVAEPCPGANDGADPGPREGAGRARGPRHPVRGHRARRPPGERGRRDPSRARRPPRGVPSAAGGGHLGVVGGRPHGRRARLSRVPRARAGGRVQARSGRGAPWAGRRSLVCRRCRVCRPIDR